jgi:hypothetical protein
MDTEYYVRVDSNTFKVVINPIYDFYNKTKIIHYLLSVCGDYDKCVNIIINYEKSQKSKELVLTWSEVVDETLYEPMNLNDTTKMVQLAITIAKEIAPYTEYITLKDISYFGCNTPDGVKKTSLPPYYIAFNNKTWYEDKFNAVMIGDYDKYKLCIDAINREEMKPSYFNFGNKQIANLLIPLYLQASTWKSFFELIETIYPNDKCMLMYPWIDSAISYIFRQNNYDDLYVGKDWKIMIDTVPKIHYYKIGDEAEKQEQVLIKYCQQYDNYRNIDYNNVEKWDIILTKQPIQV